MADWKDVANKVIQIGMPTLGGLIAGGPVGAAAGAIKGISDALGVDQTPDAISQALTVDPDAAVKLAQIESDERKNQVIETTKQTVADLQETTKRWQADMASDSWLSKNIRPGGFLMMLLSFIALSWWHPKMPEGYFNIYETLLVTMAIAYYGSRGLEKITQIFGNRKRP